MSGLTASSIKTAAVQGDRLNDTSNAIFTDTILGYALANVVRDISIKRPLDKRVILPFTQYTTEVDISSLTIIDDENMKVEWPIGKGAYDYALRNYLRFGTNITVDLSEAPTVTSGTLTGTVTFTQNSRAISGSGTAFLTELKEGYLIGKSGGTAFYSIAKIVSDTSLVLNEPFLETGGADTVDVTKYRDSESAVRIYYGGAYTVSTTSDMPAKYDQLAILGVEAYCAMAYITGQLRTIQALATTDFASARDKVGTNNVGGDEAGKYVNIADAENKSGTKVDSYRAYAQAKWNEYQIALNKIGKIKTFDMYSRG